MLMGSVIGQKWMSHNASRLHKTPPSKCTHRRHTQVLAFRRALARRSCRNLLSSAGVYRDMMIFGWDSSTRRNRQPFNFRRCVAADALVRNRVWPG